MLNGKEIRIIFACPVYAQEGKTIIGKDGDMPWRGKISSDMKRFVSLTKGQSLIMGRKTWDSIPEKFRPFDKKLPPEEARQSIILTNDPNFVVKDLRVVVAHSLEEAVRAAKSQTVWIIGGARIYALALPNADFLHITMIYERFEGDTFFPHYDRDNWRNVHFEHLKPGETGTEEDRLAYSYLVFQRIMY